MGKIILCKKIKKKTIQMKNPPFPGNIGEKIFYHISQQAWKEWLFMQSKIINEYKLNLFDEKHRKMLVKQMLKFLNLYF